MDKNSLKEFIADELHELSWRNRYPINYGIGLWAFLNGIKEAGFNITYSEPYAISHPNQRKILHVSSEEILNGWRGDIKASPSALYDSIYEIIDRLNEGKVDLSERHRLGASARKKMEKYLLESFSRYQEGLLTETGNGALHEPVILDKLFASGILDLDRINQAISIATFGDFRFTNTPSTVSFLRDGKILDEYTFPSVSRVYDYIWGAYLLELIKLKKYPVREVNSFGLNSELEIACEHGWNILKEYWS